MKVRYLNAKKHETNPEYYPPVGTVGDVIGKNEAGAWVQWPEGTTSGDGIWHAARMDLAVVRKMKGREE